MEIRTDPSFLKLDNINIINCPYCDELLHKEVKEGKYLINECGYCRYSDRPFTIGSSSLNQHYSNGCSCEYSKQNYMYIICNNCLNPKCNNCDNKLTIGYTYEPNRLCSTCINIQNKDKFNNKWYSSTPHEKLNLYGIIKLKILAKNKNIKGYSKYTKKELVEQLIPLVNENDFPIK